MENAKLLYKSHWTSLLKECKAAHRISSSVTRSLSQGAKRSWKGPLATVRSGALPTFRKKVEKW